MHEHTQKHAVKAQSSSDRSFGLVFAVVFLIITLYPLIGSGAVRIWALVVSAAFLLLAVFIPKGLAPANRLWTKFGALLHAIVSPIALGILFFLVVTPTGLLMRLVGKNQLHLRFDPKVDSYWINRVPPGPEAASLNNQF